MAQENGEGILICTQLPKLFLGEFDHFPLFTGKLCNKLLLKPSYSDYPFFIRYSPFLKIKLLKSYKLSPK